PVRRHGGWVDLRRRLHRHHRRPVLGADVRRHRRLPGRPRGRGRRPTGGAARRCAGPSGRRGVHRQRALPERHRGRRRGARAGVPVPAVPLGQDRRRPLLTALVGVAATELLIQAATGSVDIMATAPMLALMLGLAVGIDYALFIVSRYRDELRDGVAPPRAAAVATATAGSAVVFAGVTVIIALVGLYVARIPFLTIM